MKTCRSPLSLRKLPINLHKWCTKHLLLRSPHIYIWAEALCVKNSNNSKTAVTLLAWFYFDFYGFLTSLTTAFWLLGKAKNASYTHFLSEETDSASFTQGASTEKRPPQQFGALQLRQAARIQAPLLSINSADFFINYFPLQSLRFQDRGPGSTLGRSVW